MTYPTSRRLASVTLLLVLGLAAPCAARAQDALDAKSALHVRAQYLVDLDTLHAKIVALAGAIPAEKYAWRPAPGVRSVAEVLTHVAHEWYYYVPTSVGGAAPKDFGPPREAETRLAMITGKREVLDELAKSWT